ncbi:MAG TPA: hypothetical protein QGF43_05840 [Acidimicrobiales bacterium]|nr:hypothetical protein [Acidimicrobiales bacterium]
MRVAVAAIARSTFDVDLAEEVAAAAFSVLEGLDVEVIGSAGPLLGARAVEVATATWVGTELDAMLVLQASFADSTLVVSLAENTEAPMVLWAFPEERSGGRLRLNSLCGINLAGFALRNRSRPYRWLYRHPSDAAAPEELRQAFEGYIVPRASPPDAPPPSREANDRASEVRKRLAETTVGVVGEHPAGFEPCDYDSQRLTATTGVVAEGVPLSNLFDKSDIAPEAEVDSLRQEVTGLLSGLGDVDQGALTQSLRLHVGLRGLVDEYGWSAVATRCWPECFTEFGGAACTPQALLADAGVPACCEADTYGGVTALVLQWLTGSPAFVADLVELDRLDGTGVFWHCGLAPFSMADPEVVPTATVHSNRKEPLLSEFSLKPGRVTITRFSQSAGQQRLVVGGGEMVRAPLAFSGTAGVVHFDRPVDEVLATIMSEGLEHHYGIAYGDVAEELYALARQLDLPVVRL